MTHKGLLYVEWIKLLCLLSSPEFADFGAGLLTLHKTNENEPTG